MVARQLDLSWDQVDGVLQRAVQCGLARRPLVVPWRLGMGESSFQKRHEDVTVVADLDDGAVQHVTDGHGKEALTAYDESLSEEELAEIEFVAMDMWAAYNAASSAALPDADRKITFDKLHVAMHLGAAVNRVRREENRMLPDRGDKSLKGTKHRWLYHPDHLPQKAKPQLGELVRKALKTSPAWMLQELAMEIWEHSDRQTAQKIFDAYCSRTIRFRLDPIKKVVRTIKRNLHGILNTLVSGVTNARLEGITLIQGLKRSARGFRGRSRFRDALYFHLGGLDLYPHTLTRSNS